MRLLKKILLVLVVLLLLFVAYLWIAVHEGRPDITETGDPAAVAEQIQEAVNKAAWDTTKYVSWTFPGGHDYVWDRTVNDALIRWGEFEVHLDMDEVQGKAFKAGQELNGKARDKAIQKAWSHWCNDSFWLTAPYKLFDNGTTRDLAVDKEGMQGLLISYRSGGVTPGDQYLWFYDDNGLPTGYKMWVKIIPLGGVYASWGGWKEIESGAILASEHKLSLGGILLKLTDIRGGQSWRDVGLEDSPIQL